ncbi:DNA methyltransferase [Intestinimonas butyriciproducens]|uniref:DNA methyltransferase n=1 Tax=Intestinimonas butyriciproducens TaxID=1297617 RepID=UPI0019563C0B|nr:DNA methyltransferase [Intestinimonas butyriciproducens]MBM6918984.1 hypothetical protein [Intestinimonas butyriciproducens]
MIDTMTIFEKIPIDKTSISQGELDIDNKTRSNLFAWNGQFSPQFVEALLSHYAQDGDVVIDPFAGSGTTLCEAARKGISAYGMELNASAYYMAKTYELANKSLPERKVLIDSVEQILTSISKTDEILPTITRAIQQNNPSALSALLSTLIILIDLFNNELSISLLHTKWTGLKKTVLEIPFSTAQIKVDMGDSRKLGCNSGEATLLITSPPYINVFNYHQKYRRSVEALGYDVLAIAKNEFGSNRKNRGNRLLTVIQYCIDMALSIKEAMRACCQNARMIYVVGRESNVLGYSFCNSRLIFEIATEIFQLPFLLRQERAFKNRFGQMIYEDILHFENAQTEKFLSEEDIEDAARSIAVRILSEKAQMYPDSKNIELIFEAIERAENVNRSEG